MENRSISVVMAPTGGGESTKGRRIREKFKEKFTADENGILNYSPGNGPMRIGCNLTVHASGATPSGKVGRITPQEIVLGLRPGLGYDWGYIRPPPNVP